MLIENLFLIPIIYQVGIINKFFFNIRKDLFYKKEAN